MSYRLLDLLDAANIARQNYDDASAGVDQDPLHNAARRLEVADALAQTSYELHTHLTADLSRLNKMAAIDGS